MELEMEMEMDMESETRNRYGSSRILRMLSEALLLCASVASCAEKAAVRWNSYLLQAHEMMDLSKVNKFTKCSLLVIFCLGPITLKIYAISGSQCQFTCGANFWD